MSSTSLPLIRPLAIPVEHGGWGFLLEPIVLGLAVAPSIPGVSIGVGALAIFLIRQPFKLAMHDWTRKRYPRTAVCEALVLMYGLAALLAFGLAMSRALIPLLFAVPFGALQFVYDYRKQNRTFIAELSGAIAPAFVIAAIVLAGGRPMAFAAVMSGMILARAIPSVLFVRAALRGSQRAAHVLLAHLAAVVFAAFVSWGAFAATVLLFARSASSTAGVRAQTIGIREIGWGACFVLLVALGCYF